MIEINGLTKKFRGHEVLSGAILSVQRGEVAVLLGPSGSGKSTLLRTINGLESFDAGSIRVDDIHLAVEPGPKRDRALVEIRKRVGMVFQQFNLFPHLTAIENIIEAPVHVLKQPRKVARELALGLLERVGLANQANAYPRSLSGGQQQRVAIARALAMQPEVILLDEPTSALDPSMTGEVVKVIQDLANSGQTMLVVTHGIRFARSIGTRIHVLAHGSIVESGLTQAVFENPQHAVTKQLLNEN